VRGSALVASPLPCRTTMRGVRLPHDTPPRSSVGPFCCVSHCGDEERVVTSLHESTESGGHMTSRMLLQGPPEILSAVVDAWGLRFQNGTEELMTILPDWRVTYESIAGAGICCAGVGRPTIDTGSMAPTSGRQAQEGWRYRIERESEGEGRYDLIRLVDDELVLMRCSKLGRISATGSRRPSRRWRLVGGAWSPMSYNALRTVQVILSLDGLVALWLLERERLGKALAHHTTDRDEVLFLAAVAFDVCFTRPLVFVGYCLGTPDFSLKGYARNALVIVLLSALIAFLIALADAACGLAYPSSRSKAAHRVGTMLLEAFLATTGFSSHVLPAMVPMCWLSCCRPKTLSLPKAVEAQPLRQES